jgi:hypothetical protein
MTTTAALERAEPYGGLAIAQNRGKFSELRGSGKEIFAETKTRKLLNKKHHCKVRKVGVENGTVPIEPS